MRILGIESSADDSGVALIEASGDFGKDFRFKVLMNEVASQQHAAYGGIYPNVAKQEHLKNLPLLLDTVRKAHPERPDVIAVTVGPGLEPCLWAGITTAQKLAAGGPPAGGAPVVGVNHLEGHIIMSLMDMSEKHEARSGKREQIRMHAFEFPVLSLLISGGNTKLVLSREFMRYEVLGETRDDAAGEAFDKIARTLGLPYPGGPHISRLAEEARSKKQESRTKLPRPMLHEGNLDFSFSGLKTAVLRAVERNGGKDALGDTLRMQLAREAEEAIADVLIGKTLRAVEEYGAQTVVTGGGVSANSFIRKRLADALAEVDAKLLICPPGLSTDNGLMIALAGYFHALNKEFTDPAALVANGSLKLA